MGNILGHAPDYMAWNKWKLGWLDDPDFGCLATDGSAEYTLCPVATPSDGGLTKKGVVVRTGPTTAIVAELRAPLGNDATETVDARRAPHVRLGRPALQDRRHRSSTPTGRSRCSTPCRARPRRAARGDVDIATLGKGQGDGPSHYEDPETGTCSRSSSIEDGVSARPEGHPRAHPHHGDARRAAPRPSPPPTSARPRRATYAWAFGDGDDRHRRHRHPHLRGRRPLPVTLTVNDGDDGHRHRDRRRSRAAAPSP